MANYRAKAKWASLAKAEAQKISERTRAGMARAKAQGKRTTLSRELRRLTKTGFRRIQILLSADNARESLAPRGRDGRVFGSSRLLVSTTFRFPLVLAMRAAMVVRTQAGAASEHS
jgi:DNA invertase Pin-like site-specific DNA recombinase